jgi:hypothetical protein
MCGVPGKARATAADDTAVTLRSKVEHVRRESVLTPGGSIDVDWADAVFDEHPASR